MNTRWSRSAAMFLSATVATALLTAPLTATAQAAPRAIALVANQASASATLVDVTAGTTVDIPVGDGPHEAAILPGGRRGVVTVYGVSGTAGRQLAVIDIATRTVERMIDLGTYTRPHGVVAVPGKPDLVAVTSESTRNLLLVNVVSGSIERVVPTEAAASHMAALPTTGAAAGTRAYTANVASGSTSELDIVSGKPLRVLPVATMTEGIAVTPDGGEVWLGSNDRGTVSVVDVATGSVAATIVGFRFPYRLGISADGRTAVVVDPQSDAIFVVDVLARMIRGRVGNLDSPRGVSIAEDGKTAMVTSAGASSVILIDLTAMKELRRFPVGQSPDGVGYFAR